MRVALRPCLLVLFAVWADGSCHLHGTSVLITPGIHDKHVTGRPPTEPVERYPSLDKVRSAAA